MRKTSLMLMCAAALQARDVVQVKILESSTEEIEGPVKNTCGTSPKRYLGLPSVTCKSSVEKLQRVTVSLALPNGKTATVVCTKAKCNEPREDTATADFSKDTVKLRRFNQLSKEWVSETYKVTEIK